MWPVSDRFLATLPRSHTQTAYIDVIKSGKVVSSFQGGVVRDPDTDSPVYNLGGSVNVEKATIRRTASISLLDPDGQLIPTDVNDLFALYSTEIRVWMGVRYWDAPLPISSNPYEAPPAVPIPTEEIEYVPVITGVITQLENTYPLITMGLTDRFWYLHNFASPYRITVNTLQGDALYDLLSFKMPHDSLDLALNPTGVDNKLPDLTYDADSAVADAVQQIANYSGQQIFCDPFGTIRNSDEAKTTDPPVIVYQAGPRSMLMRPSRTIGSGEIYNAVVMTSEGGSTAPLRGFARDNNPDSMTYWKKIGIRPLFDSSPNITTQEQADTAARRKLKSILGISDAYSVPIIPNFALETQDVVQVVDEDTHLDTPMIADSFAVPLRATDGAMSLTCRVDVIEPETPS